MLHFSKLSAGSLKCSEKFCTSKMSVGTAAGAWFCLDGVSLLGPRPISRSLITENQQGFADFVQLRDFLDIFEGPQTTLIKYLSHYIPLIHARATLCTMGSIGVFPPISILPYMIKLAATKKIYGT